LASSQRRVRSVGPPPPRGGPCSAGANRVSTTCGRPVAQRSSIVLQSRASRVSSRSVTSPEALECEASSPRRRPSGGSAGWSTAMCRTVRARDWMIRGPTRGQRGHFAELVGVVPQDVRMDRRHRVRCEGPAALCRDHAAVDPALLARTSEIAPARGPAPLGSAPRTGAGPSAVVRRQVRRTRGVAVVGGPRGEAERPGLSAVIAVDVGGGRSPRSSWRRPPSPRSRWASGRGHRVFEPAEPAFRRFVRALPCLTRR